MKGLLIKDFKMMKSQKTFLVVMAGLTIFYSVMNIYSTFLMPYITMMVALFTISTISMDKQNNGHAYLFALPFSRKEYVKEKYCYCLFWGALALIFATILTYIAMVLHEATVRLDEIGAVFLPTVIIFLLLYAVMIPIQLKFSEEKSRMVFMGFFFAVFVCVYGVIRVVNTLGADIDIEGFLTRLIQQNVVMLIVLGLICSVVMMTISYMVSLRIMNKMEF